MTFKIDPCPHCGFELDGGDIFEFFLTKNNGNKDLALEDAASFGWSDTNFKRFTRTVGLYDMDLDRVIAYYCPNCDKELPD